MEHAARLALEAAGWLVLTTKHGGANKEPVDLIAISDWRDDWVWLVQCKTSGYVAPAERRELADLGARFNLDVLVASWHKDGNKARVVRFKDLEGNEVQP